MQLLKPIKPKPSKYEKQSCRGQVDLAPGQHHEMDPRPIPLPLRRYPETCILLAVPGFIPPPDTPSKTTEVLVTGIEHIVLLVSQEPIIVLLIG